MKTRFVFLIATILFVFLVGVTETHAQVEAEVQSSITVDGEVINQVTDTDFEKIVDKYTLQVGNTINEILTSVKENFTDEAQYLWKTYILSYKLNFFKALMIVALGLIITFGAVIFHKASDRDWDEGPGVPLVAGLIITFLGAIMTICSVSYLLTPEVHIIQDLLTLGAAQ